MALAMHICTRCELDHTFYTYSLQEAHQLLQRQIDEENKVDKQTSIYEQMDRELSS